MRLPDCKSQINFLVNIRLELWNGYHVRVIGLIKGATICSPCDCDSCRYMYHISMDCTIGIPTSKVASHMCECIGVNLHSYHTSTIFNNNIERSHGQWCNNSPKY